MNKMAFMQGYLNKAANTESDISDQERSSMDPSCYFASATGGRKDTTYVSDDHQPTVEEQPEAKANPSTPTAGGF